MLINVKNKREKMTNGADCVTVGEISTKGNPFPVEDGVAIPRGMVYL